MKMHKKIFSVIMSLLLVGCMAGHKITTMETFSEVHLGMTEQKLKQQLGKPNKVIVIDENEKVYQYNEKIYANDRIMEERKYLFTIRNGLVTSKKVLYDNLRDKRDAFELQTTYNKETKT